MVKQDQAPAIKDWVKEIVWNRHHLETPVGASASNRLAGRGVQSVEGQILVVRYALEDPFGRTQGRHYVLTWLVDSYSGVVQSCRCWR